MYSKKFSLEKDVFGIYSFALSTVVFLMVMMERAVTIGLVMLVAKL
jgi:hypothetical protein